MQKIILSIFVFLLVIQPFITPALAAKSKGNDKYASLVMDADTGMILSQRYADKQLHPASLTKMMTLLMTFEALDAGLIKKTDKIRISNHAASMVPSKLGLAPGSSIKVEDAIYTLVTKSANDIAVALAEHIGGSERKFSQLMTERAQTIGMTKTRFVNASGLHDVKQVSSARDMAKMARYILQRYPHYYRYFSTKSFTYKGNTYRNHNRLMETYVGMDGFKTGYVNASGFNLVASAYRDGHRLIGVVFGGRSSQTRNDHMKEILDAGFKKVDTIRIAAPITPPVPKAKPLIGLASSGNVVPSSMMAKQNDNMSNFTSLASLDSKTKIITAQPKHKDYTELTQALQSGAFSEMIGEGDFDPSASKRLETGLIAVAVHKGEYDPNPEPATALENSLNTMGHKVISHMKDSNTNANAAAPAPLPHPKDIIGTWSVQIGAYNSKLSTDEALRNAQEKLPENLSKASPIAVPLNTANGMIFRARLSSLSEAEAKQACEYLKECMIIAPMSTQITAK